MRTQRDENSTIDDLDLALETLKDLTPTMTQADAVRGGATTPARGCYCGTL